MMRWWRKWWCKKYTCATCGCKQRVDSDVNTIDIEYSTGTQVLRICNACADDFDRIAG